MKAIISKEYNDWDGPTRVETVDISSAMSLLWHLYAIATEVEKQKRSADDAAKMMALIVMDIAKTIRSNNL